MNDILVTVFARTDIGMQRSGNEDAFLVADLTTGNVGLGPDMSTHRVGERGSLMVVSDGMGGAVAGEIASELAVTSIRESLMEMPHDLSISDRLKMSSEIANERVWSHAQQNPELSGMGATLTAVLVHETVAYISQVGDSRAYLVRGHQIKQLTKDQSLAQMLIDTGAIEPEQAASVPQNVIMQALGTQPTVKVALTAVELCRNDCLLVCSDGLSNKIRPEEMRETVLEAPNLTAACRRLVEIANQRGGEDNITVIIARFDGESLHSSTDSSSITGSFRSLNEDYISDKAAGITSQLASPAPPQPPAETPTTIVMPAIPRAVEPEPVAVEPVEQAASAVEHEDVTIPLGAPETRPERPAPALEETEAARAKQKTITTKPQQQKQLKKRSWVMMLLLLLVVLIALAAAGYYFGYFDFGRSEGESQADQPAESSSVRTTEVLI